MDPDRRYTLNQVRIGISLVLFIKMRQLNPNNSNALSNEELSDFFTVLHRATSEGLIDRTVRNKFHLFTHPDKFHSNINGKGILIEFHFNFLAFMQNNVDEGNVFSGLNMLCGFNQNSVIVAQNLYERDIVWLAQEIQNWRTLCPDNNAAILISKVYNSMANLLPLPENQSPRRLIDHKLSVLALLRQKDLQINELQAKLVHSQSSLAQRNTSASSNTMFHSYQSVPTSSVHNDTSLSARAERQSADQTHERSQSSSICSTLFKGILVGFTVLAAIGAVASKFDPDNNSTDDDLSYEPEEENTNKPST